MHKVTDLYLEALRLVNLSRLSASTGRAYRTLQAYRRGERRVTEAAAQELANYLRQQAEEFTNAADDIEAALSRKEGGDE